MCDCDRAPLPETHPRITERRDPRAQGGVTSSSLSIGQQTVTDQFAAGPFRYANQWIQVWGQCPPSTV